jgi:acylphosphatase
VITNITTEDDLKKALENAGRDKVIVEQHITGKDYRLLVVGGVFTAAVLRHPTNVIGDGQTSIGTLIEQKNDKRSRNPNPQTTTIKLDTIANKRMSEAGLTLESILDKGQTFVFQDVGNVHRGGDSEDVTHQIHPDFIKLAEDCWKAFPDLAYCGIDLIAEDVTRPSDGQLHAVNEINANCDLGLHHFPTMPSEHAPVNVTAAIIDYVFPNQARGPVLAKRITVSGSIKSDEFQGWIAKQCVRLDINGQCRALDHRRVRIDAEGTQASIDALLQVCSTYTPVSTVKKIGFSDAPLKNFTTFTSK